MRPEIERSDRPEARQNSGFGWRGHKKLKKINLLLKNENSNNSGTQNNSSKKVLGPSTGAKWRSRPIFSSRKPNFAQIAQKT